MDRKIIVVVVAWGCRTLNVLFYFLEFEFAQIELDRSLDVGVICLHETEVIIVNLTGSMPFRRGV